jgi:DNA-binding transcriptional LysR family regulator
MRAFRRSLRYFELVARNQSVRAAADALRIAPSAVSRAVQQLEDEIGVQLFDRTARGLQLTAAGETMLAYMQRWGREAEQLTDAVRSLSGVRLETIRVASVEVATYELVPQAIAAVRQRVPGLRVDLKVGDTQAVLESLLNGSADFAVVINSPKTVPVRSIWTMSNPVGLVVPHGHRLAEHKAIRVADCTADPLILPEEPLAARSSIRSALEAAGPYRIAATSNRIVSIKALLRAGLGITFLTRLDVAAEERAREFRFIPLDDPTIEHPYVSIVAPRGGKRTPVMDLMIETLRKAMPSSEFRG